MGIGVGVVVASGWAQAANSSALKAKRKVQYKTVLMGPNISKLARQRKRVHLARCGASITEFSIRALLANCVAHSGRGQEI